MKMRTFGLNNYGVQEMNAVEMRETNGGSFLIGLIIGFIVTAIYLLVTKIGGQDLDCPCE